MISGDRILKIEGVLSGSLSFIFNKFTSKVKFSDLVKEARAKGYTEPDPRDDLSLKDISRKICILAREAGMHVNLEHVVLEKILSLAGLELLVTADRPSRPVGSGVEAPFHRTMSNISIAAFPAALAARRSACSLIATARSSVSGNRHIRRRVGI